MKAVAFAAPGRMELRDVPDPQPGPGEVAVAVRYCGICGSDLHEYTSQAPSLRAAGLFQPIMGHEFTGIVAALGPYVDGLAAGDPVVVHPGGACGGCWHCRRGLANLCAEQMGTGYRRPGGYAERTVVRADQALRLPHESWLKPAALTEPFAVALRAVNRGALGAGETVFVAGGGPIGLLSVLAAQRKGAGMVIVSEPAAPRRELALSLGADFAVDPAQSASLQVREITHGLGCDLAVEAAGIAATMDDCLAAARRGGRIVVAGAFEQPYPVNLLNLLVQEQSIAGTFGYTSEFREARDLIVSGAVDMAPLISRTVPLAELPAVFEQLATDRGSGHKVLVAPGG
ncbi:MAG: alcohol dehydrogenase catalytic domain-containing protein [Dehalococcoidia bacterium]|nr:alcohol dehydrogenase catalytic domain-containing protein [Dehalococcoidia bacterium]